MSLFASEDGRTTKPWVWAAAIVCTVLAIAIIITGGFVIAVYIIYKPTAPHFEVARAHLDKLVYDQFGLFEIEMSLTLVAENRNRKAHASFSDQRIFLQFYNINVALLRAEPFEVSKNNSFELAYHFQSRPMPLGERAMDAMDVALKRGIVPFKLMGRARTRWKVGVFVSVKFVTRLSCHLNFFFLNGSTIDSHCS